MSDKYVEFVGGESFEYGRQEQGTGVGGRPDFLLAAFGVYGLERAHERLAKGAVNCASDKPCKSPVGFRNRAVLHGCALFSHSSYWCVALHMPVPMVKLIKKM